MPHVAAKIPPELHLALIDAVRAGGKPAELRPLFDDVSEWTIQSLTAHVPRGTKQDAVRASVLARVQAGEYARTIASIESCSLSFVCRLARAWQRELEACERLSAMKAPRRKIRRHAQAPAVAVEQPPTAANLDSLHKRLASPASDPKTPRPRDVTRETAKPRGRKLSDEAIIEIREFAAAGIKDTEIAETYGISAVYVRVVRTGNVRDDLGGPRTRKRA